MYKIIFKCFSIVPLLLLTFASKRKSIILCLLCCILSISLLTEAMCAGPHKHHRYPKITTPQGEYKYVDNIGLYSLSNPNGYPAPCGEEDRELLPETWAYVRATIGYTERHDGSHPAVDASDTTWWFSQVIGNDPTSSGTHFADMINYTIDNTLVEDYFNPNQDIELAPGVSRYYGAAFDIVLTQVSVPANLGGPLPQFGPYVTNLRQAGIVCWHRWVHETSSGTVENEIHCIDPASPIIKNYLLNNQIYGSNGYLNGGFGSASYKMDFGGTLPGDSHHGNVLLTDVTQCRSSDRVAFAVTGRRRPGARPYTTCF